MIETHLIRYRDSKIWIQVCWVIICRTELPFFRLNNFCLVIAKFNGYTKQELNLKLITFQQKQLTGYEFWFFFSKQNDPTIFHHLSSDIFWKLLACKHETYLALHKLTLTFTPLSLFFLSFSLFPSFSLSPLSYLCQPLEFLS